jgi:hypothetical protein
MVYARLYSWKGLVSKRSNRSPQALESLVLDGVIHAPWGHALGDSVEDPVGTRRTSDRGAARTRRPSHSAVHCRGEIPLARHHVGELVPRSSSASLTMVSKLESCVHDPSIRSQEEGMPFTRCR